MRARPFAVATLTLALAGPAWAQPTASEGTPTTPPVQVNPGLDGDAPSREIPVPAARPPDPGTERRGLTTAEAKVLIGRTVTSADGRAVGRIHDFLFRGAGGPVAHAVVARGGFLGMGERLFAVPAERLGIKAAAEGRVVLDMTAAEVAAAPSFDYDGSASAMVGRP